MRPAAALLPFVLLAAACGREQPAKAKGGPWTADAHTHAAVARMEAVLAATSVPGGADAGVYHGLGAALQQEVDALIAGCTMQGPDHERLHVWLGELLPAVRTLRESPDLGALRQAHQTVAGTLKGFHTLFPQQPK